jgi:hypothetical protein
LSLDPDAPAPRFAGQWRTWDIAGAIDAVARIAATGASSLKVSMPAARALFEAPEKAG